MVATQTKQTAPPPPRTGNSRRPFGGFWQRVTEGLELAELWKQFESEARATYGFYSRDVDWEAVSQKKGLARGWAVTKAFFWAVLMKLSPARRVLLLLGLLLLVAGDFSFGSGDVRGRFDFGAFGVLSILLVLVLELADKVTMKRDLEIAREIQRWLVPETPPQVAGLDIGFSTRPANTVAGDYYDTFFRDEEHTKLLLVVADVAGKSMPAALLMATFQASLHSSAYGAHGLGELVTRLNQFACTRSRGGERFTTAFLGELDVAMRTLSYVNAGHNAPVLRRVSGAIERLQAGGLPFGIDPAARYESGSTKLERNDLLLIFTDGLVEAVNTAGEEYGEERMLYMLQTVPGESAGETIRHLLQNVEEFVGRARQHDDITLLVLRSI